MKVSAERQKEIRERMRWFLAQMEKRREELDAPMASGLTPQQHTDERTERAWHFIGATTFCREELSRMLDELEGRANPSGEK